VISTTSACSQGRRSESKGRISSPRPYIRASGTELRSSLEGSESRVEPEVWRQSVGGESGVCAEAWRSPELGAFSRWRGSRERERAGESLPAPGQSEVIGPRRNPCIAEGRTGSDRASTLIEHQLLSSTNAERALVDPFVPLNRVAGWGPDHLALARPQSGAADLTAVGNGRRDLPIVAPRGCG